MCTNAYAPAFAADLVAASGCESSNMITGTHCHRHRVLLATMTEKADTLIALLGALGDVDVRIITETPLRRTGPSVRTRLSLSSSASGSSSGSAPHMPQRAYVDGGYPQTQMNAMAAELVEWADAMVLAPLDAGGLGTMLAGLTGTLTLTVLRGWDTKKEILMIPEMSIMEWENPLTKRQMDALARDWVWVEVLPPILTRLEGGVMVETSWEGRSVFCEAAERRFGGRKRMEKERPKRKRKVTLPMEILLMVFERLDDWETAAAVGVPAKISMPPHWAPHMPLPSVAANPPSLEYILLRGSLREIQDVLRKVTPLTPLSDLVAHLILKFSRTDVLSFLIESRTDLFWSTRALASLPSIASTRYGNTALLDWWLCCTAITPKNYGPDCVDGASRAGFTSVLQWWRTSGFEFKYTERALEAASAHGHTRVLDWWKEASSPSSSSSNPSPLPLKTGKSVLLAAQTGAAESLGWWDASGLAYSHGESVARIASNHGHVSVLQRWFERWGGKMAFDNQVLVGATKNGYVEVLEWWKRSGLRVEFKTCDIEEALEDAVAGKEGAVRRWWEEHGLNLGVGISEWMKVKVL